MRIKKVSQTTTTNAQIVDGHSDSTEDGYSCNYVNSLQKGTLIFNPSTPSKDDNITFTSSLSAGNYIEIIYGRYRVASGTVVIKSTGKLPFSAGMVVALDELYISTGNLENNCKIVNINSTGLTTESKLNDNIAIVKIIKY